MDLQRPQRPGTRSYRRDQETKRAKWERRREQRAHVLPVVLRENMKGGPPALVLLDPGIEELEWPL